MRVIEGMIVLLEEQKTRASKILMNPYENSASIAKSGMNTSRTLVRMLLERTGYHA